MGVISLLRRMMFQKTLDLGVLWDSQMAVISEIANVCKTIILHLGNVLTITTRKFMECVNL